MLENGAIRKPRFRIASAANASTALCGPASARTASAGCPGYDRRPPSRGAHPDARYLGASGLTDSLVGVAGALSLRPAATSACSADHAHNIRDSTDFVLKIAHGATIGCGEVADGSIMLDCAATPTPRTTRPNAQRPATNPAPCGTRPPCAPVTTVPTGACWRQSPRSLYLLRAASHARPCNSQGYVPERRR